jgi:hypothetical protein
MIATRAVQSPALAPLSQRLDDKNEFPEHAEGTGLASLEVTGGQAPTCGDFVSGAKDCLVWIVALVPDQHLGPGTVINVREF